MDIQAIVPMLSDWLTGNPATRSYLMLAGFDIVLGTIRAIKEQQLASNISGEGMTRKAVRVILILLGESFEQQANGMPLSEMIAAGFASTELLSVLENCARLGVPLPEGIVNVLSKVVNKSDTLRGKAKK